MKKQKTRNRVRCTHCNNIIESIHVHNYVTCSCGRIAVDGGSDYQRLAFKKPTDLMIVLDDDTEKPLEFNKLPGSEIDGKVEQVFDLQVGLYYKYFGTKDIHVRASIGEDWFNVANNLHIHILCLTLTEKHGFVFLAETDSGRIIPVKDSPGEPIEWSEIDSYTWRQAISVNERYPQEKPW